ncbi:hypothetical protein BaRGS_00031222, partial [Batillaria attramentaria]
RTPIHPALDTTRDQHAPWVGRSGTGTGLAGREGNWCFVGTLTNGWPLLHDTARLSYSALSTTLASVAFLLTLMAHGDWLKSNGCLSFLVVVFVVEIVVPVSRCGTETTVTCPVPADPANSECVEIRGGRVNTRAPPASPAPPHTAVLFLLWSVKRD